MVMNERVESLENTVSSLVSEVNALRTAVTEVGLNYPFTQALTSSSKTSPQAASMLRALLGSAKTVPSGRSNPSPLKAAFGFFPFFSKSSSANVEAKEGKASDATVETVVAATTSVSQAPDRPQDVKAASDNKDVGFQIPKLDLPVIKCLQTPKPLQVEAKVGKAAGSDVTKVPAPAMILPAQLMKPIPLAPINSNGRLISRKTNLKALFDATKKAPPMKTVAKVDAEITAASGCEDEMTITTAAPIANDNKVEEAAAGLLELHSRPLVIADEVMALIELSVRERIFDVPVEVQALLELKANDRAAVVDIDPKPEEIDPLMLLATAAEGYTSNPFVEGHACTDRNATEVFKSPLVTAVNAVATGDAKDLNAETGNVRTPRTARSTAQKNVRRRSHLPSPTSSNSSPGSDTGVAKTALSVTDPKTPSATSPLHLAIGTPRVLSRRRRTTTNPINSVSTTSTPRTTSTTKKAIALDPKSPTPTTPPHLSIGNTKVLSRQHRTTSNPDNSVSATSTPRPTSTAATKKAMGSAMRQAASPAKRIKALRIEATRGKIPNIKVFGKERAARFQECGAKGLGPDPKAWEASHTFRFGRGDDGCLYGIIANSGGELRRPPVRLSLGSMADMKNAEVMKIGDVFVELITLSAKRTFFTDFEKHNVVVVLE
ncbi:hypothetical protein HDU97_009871 [Phlyctochytrium planicorne]|nr:hypothetical protein HDU97_009871 [Phlyctochytrium planicorne]